MANSTLPASASVRKTSNSEAAGSLRTQATSARESTTFFDPGIVISPFGRALFLQRFRQARTRLHHSAHGAPVGKFGNHAFHNNGFALDLNLHFSPRLQ